MENTTLNYFLFTVVIIGFVISVAATLYVHKSNSSLKRKRNILLLNVGLLGALLLLLYFALPQTSILSTFGMPQSDEDIQSAKALVKYLQEYNTALVKTIIVLRWFIFVFVLWFLVVLMSYIYILTNAIGEYKE